LRIAHWPQNIANHAHRLAVAQRKLGHEVVVYGRKKADVTYGYTSDVYIEGRLDPIHFNLDMLRRSKELNSFDVIHNHGGIWLTQLVYYLVRKPKLFIEYHGIDAREGVGLHHQRLADGFFYSTPDLRHRVPRSSMWLPHPIELRPLPEPPQNKRTVFAHFVSTEKGTDKFIDLFHQAFGKTTGHLFSADGKEQRYAAKEAELRVYTMVPQERVFAAMQQADVVLDRWNQYGIYGYVSVEAMAFGKPVIADIDPLLYPEDCPVLYPTADTLKLMMDEYARKFAGQLGRKYVERVHEASVVAKKSISAFEGALNL
jgi:glycosyltransferase involved in cell wall biosynthesis